MITSANAQKDIRQTVDGLAHTADKAIDSTRSYTNDALDAAEQKIDTLSHSVKPALEKLTRSAEQYAHQGMDMAINAKDKVRESLSHYGACTERYVAEKPVKSMLIAATVGAAVAMLVSSAFNRNHR